MLIDDMFDLMIAIQRVNDHKGCSSVSYEWNSGKEYWSINFNFKWANASYSDCVVVYSNGDDFNKDDFLISISKILSTAERMIEDL